MAELSTLNTPRLHPRKSHHQFPIKSRLVGTSPCCRHSPGPLSSQGGSRLLTHLPDKQLLSGSFSGRQSQRLVRRLGGLWSAAGLSPWTAASAEQEGPTRLEEVTGKALLDTAGRPASWGLAIGTKTSRGLQSWLCPLPGRAPWGPGHPACPQAGVQECRCPSLPYHSPLEPQDPLRPSALVTG